MSGEQATPSNSEAIEEEPLVWVPLAKRKRARVAHLHSRRGVGGDTTTAASAASGGGAAAVDDAAAAVATATAQRSKMSLLDEVALEMGERADEPEELVRKRKEEEELRKTFEEFKPLVAVHEAAAGVAYTESMRRSWRPPRWLSALDDAAVSKMRSDFHIIVTGEEVPPPVPRFTDLKMPRCLVEQLANAGIKRPTPIQMQGLPAILCGRDMIGVAFTGSGKTLVFSLPMILFALEAEMRMPFVDGEGPVGIVLAPSRELARQTFEQCEKMADTLHRNGYPKLRGSLLIGGVSKGDQLRDMRGGWHFCVATPGRLNDLLNSGKFKLNNCSYLCLDEADRLVDMGFEDDMRNVMNHFPKQRQTLLFSATMPLRIQQFARSALVRPVEVNVGRSGAANLDVIQEVEYVKQENKMVYLLEVLQKTPPPVLIFCENTADVDDIHEYLLLKGVEATSVHGSRTQEERTVAIRQFKAGEKDVLIASDVASKGLDFADVKHVINYDMPKEIENYVHRIGRTGRGGKTGIATTFINKSNDEEVLLDLKYLLIEAKQRIPLVLQMLEDPEADLNEDGQRVCLNCGGLGHAVSRCPKLAATARQIRSSHREFLRD